MASAKVSFTGRIGAPKPELPDGELAIVAPVTPQPAEELSPAEIEKRTLDEAIANGEDVSEDEYVEVAKRANFAREFWQRRSERKAKEAADKAEKDAVARLAKARADAVTRLRGGEQKVLAATDDFKAAVDAYLNIITAYNDAIATSNEELRSAGVESGSPVDGLTGERVADTAYGARAVNAGGVWYRREDRARYVLSVVVDALRRNGDVRRASLDSMSAKPITLTEGGR